MDPLLGLYNRVIEISLSRLPRCLHHLEWSAENPNTRVLQIVIVLARVYAFSPKVSLILT